MKNTWWQSGEWNALCDVCGFKFKNTQLKERWDGLRVCADDWETRHPQEMIRPLPAEKPLPWTRPEGSSDQFIVVDYTITLGCTIEGQFSQADTGTADCAIVGNINPSLVP